MIHIHYFGFRCQAEGQFLSFYLFDLYNRFSSPPSHPFLSFQGITSPATDRWTMCCWFSKSCDGYLLHHNNTIRRAPAAPLSLSLSSTATTHFILASSPAFIPGHLRLLRFVALRLSRVYKIFTCVATTAKHILLGMCVVHQHPLQLLLLYNLPIHPSTHSQTSSPTDLS